jgi:phosphoribosylformylglycinamidine synthase
MVGILEDVDLKTTLNFKSEGDLIYMLGNSYNDVGSSEYLRTWHGIQYSPVPHFDMHEEYEIQSRIKELINQGLLESAHDVSEGGLFVNLMESAIVGGFGFQVETVETFKKDAFLFGESQSRIVVSIQPNREDDLQNFLISNNVSFTKLGEVFGNEAIIDEINFGSIEEWKRFYENTLSEKIEGK